VSRYRFISAEQAHNPITILCRVLDVGRSGYSARARRGVSARAHGDEALAAQIAQIREERRRTYGMPRVRAALHARGVRRGSRWVARLMRAAGRAGCHRRRRTRTTVADPTRAPAPNLVARDFAARAPDRLWVGDSTYIATWEGWLYLAVLLDAHSRRVIGWAMADHLRTELALDALTMALDRRRPATGLVHHTDRGCQYTAAASQEMLTAQAIAISMSRVGDCYDNALAERFFATLKRELVDRHPWPTRRAARQAIFAWIEIFSNRQRSHSALGYRSPVAFESTLAGEAQAA